MEAGVHVARGSERERLQMRSPINVIRSPTLAGGLFAVRNILDIWGLKIQEREFGAEKNVNCPLGSGSLETHPCAHIGHIFPKQAPYSCKKAQAKSVHAGEVWVDEFKELYYHSVLCAPDESGSKCFQFSDAAYNILLLLQSEPVAPLEMVNCYLLSLSRT